MSRPSERSDAPAGLGYLRDFLDDAIHSDENVVRAVDTPCSVHISRDHDSDGRLVTITVVYGKLTRTGSWAVRA